MSEIANALTPEEWAQKRWATTNYEVNSVVSLSETAYLLQFSTVRDGKSCPTTVQPFARPREFMAIMALANAALPPTDPHKITWADVDGLVELRQLLHAAAMSSAVKLKDLKELNERIDGVEATIAKLAAILPPRVAEGER